MRGTPRVFLPSPVWGGVVGGNLCGGLLAGGVTYLNGRLRGGGGESVHILCQFTGYGGWVGEWGYLRHGLRMRLDDAKTLWLF